MRFSHIFLVQILCFLLYTCKVDAIKCFQCNSYDEGCSALTETNVDSEYFKDCDIQAHKGVPFCRKTLQTIMDTVNIVRITRSCGWLTTTPNRTRCINNDTQFKLDVTCECHHDGCNSAPYLLAKSTFLHVVTAIFAIVMIKTAL